MATDYTGHKVKVYDENGTPVIEARYDSADMAYRQAEILYKQGSANVENHGWITFSCVSVFSCTAGECYPLADYEA